MKVITVFIGLLLLCMGTVSRSEPINCDALAVGGAGVRPILGQFTSIDTSRNMKLEKAEIEAYNGDLETWPLLLDRMDTNGDLSISVEEFIIAEICQVCGSSNPCGDKMCVVKEDMSGFTCR